MANRYTDANPYITGERPRPSPRGRSSRPDGWWIELHEDGTCDVLLDRRAIQYDVEDLAAAVKLIERREPDAKLTIIEPSGYRLHAHLPTVPDLS